MIASVGAFGFGFSQLFFLVAVIEVHPWRYRQGAGQNPWEGADTLEWTHLPSPPPYHSFEDSAGGEVRTANAHRWGDHERYERTRLSAQRAANRRTALVLASIALAFFLGIVAKYWFIR